MMGERMLQAVQLGNSGLRVSQLVLGTMNFGEPGRGHQGDWTLGIDEARPIFEAALEHGLFYFDCADIYGLGACEEVVGALLRELAPRDQYVLATKISMPMGAVPTRAAVAQARHRGRRRMPAAYWASTTSTSSSSTAIPTAIPGHGVHADRRDARGAPRRRQGGQGALPGCVVDVRLAVRRAPADRRAQRLDEVRARCRTTTTSSTARKSGR